MQKILITGISGFLGSHLYKALQNDFEVVGTYHHAEIESLPNIVKVDFNDKNAITKVFVQHQPDIVIHTAAISSIAACEKNEAYSYNINVEASTLLAALSKEYNAKFIFCSTDLVFDGKKGNYLETDLPNPINVYAKQKLKAEQDIKKTNNHALIVRLPLMIGDNKNGVSGVVAEMQKNNEQVVPMYLFTNEYRSAALVEDIVKGFEILVKEKVSGIFHLAGNQALNRLQIAQWIKNKYRLEKLKLIPTTHHELRITNRPENVSLNITKMKEMGYNPSLWF